MQDTATLLDSPDTSPDNNQEGVHTFLPTPNRVSQYLELKTEEVEAQMQSVEGRREIYDLLVQHEEDLKVAYPDFSSDQLRVQLDLVGETLTSMEKFTESMQHEQGIFHRALESAVDFAKRRPITTAAVLILTTLAAAAGGVAAAAYFAGGMESLLASVGLSHLYGSAGAAEASAIIGEKIIEGAGKLYDGSTAVDML